MPIRTILLLLPLTLTTVTSHSPLKPIRPTPKPTEPPAPTTCPELPKECSCLKQNAVYEVNCNQLVDMESFLEIFKSSFTGKTIGHLYIHLSNITLIPANAFGGLVLNQIFFKQSVVQSISEQAFNGTLQLSTVNFERVPDITRIPKAVVGTNLTVFRFDNGSLVAVDTQLQNMTELSVLDLSVNNISYVHPEAFLNCRKLQRIDLSSNQIEYLDKNIFQNAVHLSDVSLKSNKLTSLEGVLEPCAFTLNKLMLTNNLLSNVSDVISSSAPNLQSLYLSNNPLVHLKENDFSKKFIKLEILMLDNSSLVSIEENTFNGLAQLKTLFLRSNNLTQLPDSTFSYMYSLYGLYLDDNQLSNISGLFKYTKNLHKLTLSNNMIENITGVFDSLLLLERLALKGNLIEEIPNGTFAKMPRLNFLSLQENQIRTLCNGSFIGLHQKLLVLSLSHNHLEHLGDAFANRKLLTVLRHLWLDHNLLTSVSSQDFNLVNLADLNLGNNNISILDNAFINLQNLGKVDVSGNHLETITRDNFPTRLFVRVIMLKGNPLSCDCRMLWLVDAFHHFHHIGVEHSTRCVAPFWMKGLYLHKLTTKTIINWKEKTCPPQCHACQCHPIGRDISITVSCDHMNLTSIPKVYPAKTVNVTFASNLLQELPKNLMQFFPGLLSLDVSGNMLTSLVDVQMPLGLRQLNVSGNRLTKFPSEYYSNLNMTNVSLSSNPWTCDCKADSFRLWLIKNLRVISDVNETKCADTVQNGKLGGKTIANLAPLDLCPVEIALYAAIAIGILAVLLTATGSFIGYIRYQMPIKVWLYTHGMCVSWVKEEDLDEDKDFDAFISYSNDEQHIVEELLEELENKKPFYRLCVHYRDFLAGEDILENISRAVSHSKKTLILLSRNFLKSDWGLTEFSEAYRKMMEEKVKRIILVRVGDLPPIEEIENADLRTYLTTATYLQWEKKYFWENLRYAMPKHPVPRISEAETVVNFSEDEQEPFVNSESGERY